MILMLKNAAEHQNATGDLVSFLTDLKFEDLPENVVSRTKSLFLDWLGSCMAGSTSRQIKIMASFLDEMAPKTGKSEVIPTLGSSTPLFAALLNGASSHVVEQDDLYNAAVLHPATVVFPAALAAAQERGVSGEEFITASVAGYEAGARVGEYLGRSHYKVFHTTGTAGTFGAAAAVSHILGADFEEMLNSFGSAGTQAAGLWEFLRDGADSKQLHTGKAAANGLMAAYLAHGGFTGARNVVEGEQGLGAGTSTDTDSSKLTADLGKKWAVLDTSLKYHASCRHTHPSADALDLVLKQNRVSADDIKTIKAHVYQAAIDVLGPVTDPNTVHQSKFSMPFVLSVLSVLGDASIHNFNDQTLHDPKIREFMKKVEMVYDEDVDSEYPRYWNGYVEVELNNGKRLKGDIKYPKGDPENFLTDEEIRSKFKSLGQFSGLLKEGEDGNIIDRVMKMEEMKTVGRML